MVSSHVFRALLLEGETMQASIFLLMSSQLTSTTTTGPLPLLLLSIRLPLEIGEKANVMGYPVGRSSSDQEMGDDDGDDADEEGKDDDSSR